MSKAAGIDRRQATTLTACGATIVFALSPTARHLDGVGGMSADVWEWSVLAVGVVLLLASLFLLVLPRRPVTTGAEAGLSIARPAPARA